MAIIFWDSEGLLLMDYLPSKKTITGQYNTETSENCHWVFGFFMTMCKYTSHLLHSKLFATVDSGGAMIFFLGG